MEYIKTPLLRKIDSQVFFTTFGKNSRLELNNSMFGLKDKNGKDKSKLAILLQKLDDNNKQIASLTLYIDLPKALVMANDILSGKYAVMAKGSEDIVTVFKDMGGQPASKANRPDKKPLYREFSIQKGRMWLFRGVSGPGKETSTGGFAPDGKSETLISVGMDDDTIKAVALMIQNEYQAYRTAQFLKIPEDTN